MISPSTPHILVVGPGKTGTTGLYTSVKRGLREAGVDARTLFEPPGAELIDNLFRYAPHVPVMTKVTLDRIDRVVPDLRVFERTVMTVRDPRDVLVSALLFRPLTVRAIRRTDEATVHRFIAALEEKEADPSAHSVRGLFDLANRLGIGSPPFRRMVASMNRQRQLRDDGLVHVVHYERFVQGDLGDLSTYLGFEVVNTSARDATWIGHIARSQSSGDFTRWFTDDDLAYFNRLYGEHLRAFGYDVDVALDADPKIDPATSSEYVRNRHADRRAQLAAGGGTRWSPSDVNSPEAFDRLVEKADDGDPGACLQAAQVLLGGHLGAADETAALRWARSAAQLGSVQGMRLTVQLLDRLDPDEPALRRELGRWRRELRDRAPRRGAAARRMAELEAEVKRLEGSARYRVGSLLADAAGAPLSKGPRAAKELFRTARRRRRHG